MGSNLQSLVDQELKERGADSETAALWSSIFAWYEDGGPGRLKTEVSRLVAQTAKAVKKGLKEAKEAAPAKATRRRRH